MTQPPLPLGAEETLHAAAPRLAELAAQHLYAEQPQLERMGAKGRAHTVEDFGHHLRALSSLDVERFTDYVRYCMGLFDARGFPQAWLTDAWRHMEVVIL
ncbi:MAG TPA: hypothetical protein VGR61_07935, partial [Candidatus Dormibacteraeota bacterium]|nr:hypothetical protein [Candidatus Dormibacteraeota bacterium]